MLGAYCLNPTVPGKHTFGGHLKLAKPRSFVRCSSGSALDGILCDRQATTAKIAVSTKGNGAWPGVPENERTI